MSEPSTNGRFLPGNPGGPGNPHAGQVARLRSVMLDAVTEDDLRAVTRKLVEMALAGDLKAVDLLLNRTLGKADSGPAVAIQMNQQGQTSTFEQRRAELVERIRAKITEVAAKRGESV